MKIQSIEFTEAWSWGLIFNAFKSNSQNEIERVFMNQNNEINESTDVNLIQNVSLLDKVKNKIKSICRLGGNRSFDGKKDIDDTIRGMSQCYALIATNKKLYDIAKSANDNSYLIPNGLNIEEWKPRRLVVGFCANISTPQYRKYKGYDYVKEACDELGLELRTALYKDKQIPHDRMMQDFYYQIDCIVHPTLGEGCSNTLMEAAACGVPIITTREAGFHGEMMEDHFNVLFCDRTTESIRDNLLLLVNNPTLRIQLSIGARTFAVKHHNVQIIAKQYEEIFKACYQHNQELPKAEAEINPLPQLPTIPQEEKHSTSAQHQSRRKRHIRNWHNGKIVHE